MQLDIWIIEIGNKLRVPRTQRERKTGVIHENEGRIYLDLESTPRIRVFAMSQRVSNTVRVEKSRSRTSS